MANWCSNTVTFEGPEDRLKTLYKLFLKMTKLQTATGKGQIFPLFQNVNEDISYLFNIYLSDEENPVGGYIQFETKWSPDPTSFMLIANMFDVSFTYQAEEMSMGIYCEYKYDPKDCTLYTRELTDEESDSAKSCEEHGTQCRFDDCDRYEDWDVMDNILEKKEWIVSDYPVPTKYKLEYE